ncbi:MAG: biotin attachment protein [Planctomycetia bacterium]|jgi:pyruvate/2-oxoglutarate dehydrogenase complex dihydrolipoamide acyltransferase (E2) component|nr:biotin attachment protein [Planctomycetia bacterium]
MQQQPPATVPLIVPDLGLGSQPILLSLWLVPQGRRVLAGDRVVELAAGVATIDLAAPVAGRCLRQLVDEDTTVLPGTVLAEFLAEDDDS